jgi:hypothetical protein
VRQSPASKFVKTEEEVAALEAVIRQPVNSIGREELVLEVVTCKVCELAIAP